MTSQIYTVQKSGNLFFINAAIARLDAEPAIVRLLVDTGASQTSFSTVLLADSGYTWDLSTPTTAMVTGNGIIRSPIVRVAWFNCLGKRVERFPVLALDLPNSIYMNGILGMDFLALCRAVIDIDNQQIRLP